MRELMLPRPARATGMGEAWRRAPPVLAYNSRKGLYVHLPAKKQAPGHFTLNIVIAW